MATARSKEAICSLVEDGTLQLDTGGHDPNYTGVVISADKLMVLDWSESKLRLHSRHDGKLVATSDQLESRPVSMCLISKTEVAVCLENSTIEILSFKSTRRIQRVNRFHVTTGFVRCDAVAKVESMDKLIVSGWKSDDDDDWSYYWCVVSLTDGHVDTIHHICKRGRGYLIDRSHLAIKYNTVYISCDAGHDSPNTGVYSYSIPNPNTRKFVYHHSDLKEPMGLTVDTRGFIFVCNLSPYSNIHQLTDRGELVTIHTLSSGPDDIFYEEQDGVLYIKGWHSRSNVITRYRLEYSHQQDPVIPAEVLKMDTRSIDMYKDALRDGKEKVYSVRVMVVGQYGVGKTTLTRRLLGKDVKISDRDSTEGIDVHTECCKVSLATGEWTTQEKNAEQYSRLQRLVKLLNERVEKQESEGEQEGQSEMGDLVTSEEHDNGHPQHDQPVSAEQGIDQEVKPTFSHSVETPVVRVGPEPSSEIGSNENEKKKDAVMEILQLVNENSGKLEKSMVEYAALALWDFAGQYVFYTTHQTFLTSRAVYLLVIDLSQQVTDFIKDDECFLDTKGIKLCKVHELIEIWLNSIHSCAPSPQDGIPPVILVGTHVDKIPEKFRQKVIDKYFMTIREMLGDKPAIYHLMDDIAIDNTQADPRLEDLKKRIFELAKQQPHWGEEKPARWLPLEQAIITLKMSGVKVVPLSLVEEINRSGSVRIEDRDELDLFLRFQHEMGTILYFSVEGLREKIMLDPQWMINAVKSLITAETFIRRNPAITSKWLEFKKRGKLTHELLDAIWSKEKSPEFHDNKDHIILLMEKLNIIARPRTYGQDGKEVKVENYFLAPCMLSKTTPQEIISPKPQKEVESSSVLCYVFIEKYLPSPIFHRLLAACVAHWPVAQKNSENLIFCGCCVFHLDLHHRLTMFFREHVISVRVTRMGTTKKTPSPKVGIEVKEFITMTLSNVIGYLEQNLRFELCIQCPKSDGDSVNSLIPVADLQGNEDVPCHVHDVSHVIMSSEVLKYWFQEEASQGEKGGHTARVTKTKEKEVYAKHQLSAKRSANKSKGNAPMKGPVVKKKSLPLEPNSSQLDVPGTKNQKRTLDIDQPGPAPRINQRDQQGILGSTTSDSVMEEKQIEAKKKHNQLCITLNGLITETSLKGIKRMAQTYLDPKTVEKVKDMDELLSSLEVKGVISVGKYDKLIEIMTLAGVEIGKDEIQKTAKDIKDIMQHRIPCHEQSEMSSLDAHTSHQGSISPAMPAKKKKPASESSSYSSSDSKSESESEDEGASHKSKSKEKTEKDKKQKLKKKQKRRKYSSKHSKAGD